MIFFIRKILTELQNQNKNRNIEIKNILLKKKENLTSFTILYALKTFIF